MLELSAPLAAAYAIWGTCGRYIACAPMSTTEPPPRSVRRGRDRLHHLHRAEHDRVERRVPVDGLLVHDAAERRVERRDLREAVDATEAVDGRGRERVALLAGR